MPVRWSAPEGAKAMAGKTRGVVAVAVTAVVVAALAMLLLGRPSQAAYTPMTATTLSTRLLTQPVPDTVPNAAQVRLGQYLVRAGDCASCHTREGGGFLGGGFALNTPFGTIYSTNLTSEQNAGIGAWTQDQFYGAMHDGTSPGGGAIYPAMPYPYTTRVTRADSDAILAFLKTVPAVNEHQPANSLSFPFSMRSLVHGWNLLFFHKGEFAPDQGKSAEWNRGAYLVTGLGHCGACHTPKNSLSADQASRALQGGTLDNWVAPDLTENDRTGIGSWNVDEVVEYLKTGRNVHANAGGSMAEVVSYSTSILNDADLHAIATYLKDQPASPEVTPVAADAGSLKRGAAVFSDVCTSCHMEEGVGQPRFFPPLRADAVAQQTDPTGVLHIILAGDRTAATVTRPSALSMPAFAWKLSDQQVADVATYVRNSWDNRAPQVTAAQSAAMRKSLGLEGERLVEGSTDR
jgi:mono/diheme cytochrome c family protein